MMMNSNWSQDLIALYKPSGLQTHRSSDQDWGLVEWLEEFWQIPLFLFQRLDKGTSGLLLLAQTQSAAQQASEQLKNKNFKKTYLFISSTKPQDDFNKGPDPSTLKQSFSIRSYISKNRGQWVSEASSTPNSETAFTLLKTESIFQLWEARPITGKTHQIRLHAQQAGIPILGDAQHGGAPFFRLCLHCLQIEDPKQGAQWWAPSPTFFDDLTLLTKPDLCALIDAQHQRDQLIKQGLLQRDSYRLCHHEIPEVKIDCLGDNLWVYDYRSSTSSPTLSLIVDFLNWKKKLQQEPLLVPSRPSPASPLPEPSKSVSSKSASPKAVSDFSPCPVWIREMKNRGAHPNQSELASLFSPKDQWIIKENNVCFEMRAHQGLSPGLFLDQRANRAWVQRNSQGKRVLNLFSYTCGFSVMAALGGATEVVSVDVSAKFLDWGKRNFSLNHLDAQKYEFWTADSLDFLQRTLKRGRRFDLIVCDPPSFGRSQKGVFRIDQKMAPLVALIYSLLADGGSLLLSTNYEKWSQEHFESEALKELNRQKALFQKISPPFPGLDFLEPHGTTLKTLILSRGISSESH